MSGHGTLGRGLTLQRDRNHNSKNLLHPTNSPLLHMLRTSESALPGGCIPRYIFARCLRRASHDACRRPAVGRMTSTGAACHVAGKERKNTRQTYLWHGEPRPRAECLGRPEPSCQALVTAQSLWPSLSCCLGSISMAPTSHGYSRRGLPVTSVSHQCLFMLHVHGLSLPASRQIPTCVRLA